MPTRAPASTHTRAPQSRETLAAIRHVEQAVGGATDLEGVILRYGGFYGPGTGIAKGEDGEILQMIRQRKMPARRRRWRASGRSSMRSTRPAPRWRRSSAARRALYNVVDDEPAPMSEWLPALAEALGAKPPRHVPVWLARLLVGEHGVNLMTNDPRRVQRQGEARTRLDADATRRGASASPRDSDRGAKVQFVRGDGSFSVPLTTRGASARGVVVRRVMVVNGAAEVGEPLAAATPTVER